VVGGNRKSVCHYTRHSEAKAFDFDGFWSAALRRFHEMAASQLRPKAGVIELLNVLDDIGLPRAVATSSSGEDVRVTSRSASAEGAFHTEEARRRHSYLLTYASQAHSFFHSRTAVADFAGRRESVCRHAGRSPQGDYVRGKPNPDPLSEGRRTARGRTCALPPTCNCTGRNQPSRISCAIPLTIMVPELLASTPEMERLWPGHQSPRPKVSDTMAPTLWPGRASQEVFVPRKKVFHRSV
jgi:hypothetical protein